MNQNKNTYFNIQLDTVNQVITANIQYKLIDIEIVKLLILELKEKLNLFPGDVSFIIKCTPHTIFTQTSRSLFAEFCNHPKFLKIAYYANNRTQTSNGNFLANSCKKFTSIDLLCSETEIERWIVKSMSA